MAHSPAQMSLRVSPMGIIGSVSVLGDESPSESVKVRMLQDVGPSLFSYGVDIHGQAGVSCQDCISCIVLEVDDVQQSGGISVLIGFDVCLWQFAESYDIRDSDFIGGGLGLVYRCSECVQRLQCVFKGDVIVRNNCVGRQVVGQGCQAQGFLSRISLRLR